MHGNVKNVTFERYERNLELHVIPALGKYRLNQLRPHHVQALYDEKRKTLSPSTVRLIHGIVSTALAQALRWQLITSNPATATKRPKPTAKEIKPLTQQQAQTLLATAVGNRYEALYLLALSTGARISELFALRWSDLDLDARTLRIERTRSAAQSGPLYTSPKVDGLVAWSSPREPPQPRVLTVPVRPQSDSRHWFGRMPT
jgi:integrase